MSFAICRDQSPLRRLRQRRFVRLNVVAVKRDDPLLAVEPNPDRTPLEHVDDLTDLNRMPRTALSAQLAQAKPTTCDERLAVCSHVCSSSRSCRLSAIVSNKFIAQRVGLFQCQNDLARYGVCYTKAVAEVFKRARNEFSVSIMFGRAFVGVSMSGHSAMTQ